MTIFASKSARGFFDDTIHGRRTMMMIDPAWERPVIAMPDPDWVGPADAPAEAAPLIHVPDMSIAPPMVEVPNPACCIPDDAREITPEQHAALLAAPGAGQIVDWTGDYPVAVDPPAPTLEQQRATRLASICASCNVALAALTASYPEREISSWPQQEREARELAVNSAMPTPMLSAIAAARGMDVVELAARVRAKSDAYAVVSGQLIGQRQALEDVLLAIDLDAPDARVQIEKVCWQA